MEEELRQVNEDELWSEPDNVSCQALDAFGDWDIYLDRI